MKILDFGHYLALSDYMQYCCLFDSRCYMYLGINIIVYILLILHKKHLFTLYPRGLIISPGADGDLYIKIDNDPLCKIKDIGQLFLWQLSNLHNCICLSKFPLKLQLNKVFFWICILKRLNCTALSSCPSCSSDLVGIGKLCVLANHFENFPVKWKPLVLVYLYEQNV